MRTTALRCSAQIPPTSCRIRCPLTSQALQAGVPLLMLPNHLEQSMFAVRLGGLRIGKALPNDAHLLGLSLREILEDSKYVERAKQFAASHVDVSLSTTLDRLDAN